MRMNTLINKFKVIRYFIKNGIFNEERAIEISKFDHNTIEALVHSQLLVQVDGRVYLDKPLYDYRYKEKYIYYGEIILLIILLIFASYVHYLKTTLFYIKILASEQGNAACEKLSNCHNLLIMRNDKKDYRNSQHFAFAF